MPDVRQPVATKGTPETDVRGVVDRATEGGPSAEETIAAHVAQGDKRKAKRAAEAEVQHVQPVADPRVVASEELLSISESKDFAQAFMNWLVGEQMSGRQQPDIPTQRSVRQGLADQLLGQRPGGMSSFARFLSSDTPRGATPR